ncbi:IS605 family transposase OrfB, partial [mine drainage metagenome]
MRYMNKKRSVLTYQTRILASVEHSARLDAYAVLYGQAERSLFAALQAGKPLNALKSDFLKRFGLTARQFNAIRINLEGQIASIKERRPGLIHEAGVRIQKAGKVISKLARVAPGSNK